MRADFYRIIRDAVEEAVPVGFVRAFKHTSRPSDDMICASIAREVMEQICEYIDFDDQYEPRLRDHADEDLEPEVEDGDRKITCPECGEYDATMREYGAFLAHLANCMPAHCDEVRLLHRRLGERIAMCDAMVAELLEDRG